MSFERSAARGATDEIPPHAVPVGLPVRHGHVVAADVFGDEAAVATGGLVDVCPARR